ncbi:anion exchange transporter [Tympanuchus pallidicinctus]|uniref:anion exchange transporter n=1 Tax=Tympanuchus pallidicinctus TaxID=109042 RepID=UPI002286E152|nr:anion exchange transporter [Tympanuchus pallidicinctus]
MTGAERRRRAVWGKIRAVRCEDIKEWCMRRLPILEWVPVYDWKENLVPDMVSGMMLAIQQVTQGLAFAALSSVHPVFGLYGSFFPVIIYAIFGMGRHVATGTFALTSLISANAVERLVPSIGTNFTANNNSGILGLSEFEMQRIGVAAAVSFLGGIIQVAMFMLQLGHTTFLLTEPVISAMTTGAATHVVTSQVKYLLGMKMPYISGPLGFFHIYAYVFENIRSVQLEALLLSLLSIVVLVLVKELNEKFQRNIKIVLPIDLVLIIATSIACCCADMEYVYGLEVVGHIPQGLPPPKLPSMNVLSEVVTEAFGVALVGYVASLALAQSSAKRFNYTVDDNQELLAHGLSNVIPSFFFCIPSAAAMGRTALLYSTGARTQVACLISCALVLVVIYTIGAMLYWLPMCVLASIIIVGLKGMLMQFRDLKKYWNVDKIDWSIWVTTYMFTICFAANVGLLYGVVCTIAIVIFRFPREKTLNLKNMKEVEYKYKTEDNCESLKQVKIVSVSNPLVFLNARKFHADLMKIIQESTSSQACEDVNKCEQNTLLCSFSNGGCHGESLQPCQSERRILILDCRGLHFFDYTGVSMLLQIYMDCKSRHIEVLLACCKASLIKAMQYGGNLESENPIFFDSISSAIDANQISRVRLTAGVGEVWGLLGCSLSFDKAFIWENVTYSVNLLYRNILSVYSAASPQSVDCIYHVFPDCSLFLPPSLLLQ